MEGPTMATTSRSVEYPTSDGKPMAETDVHRDVMFDLIAALQEYYAHDPMTYVSGDLMMFYEEGNKRRHLAPDVFVVKGAAKHRRLNYLIWEEGKAPDLVIEVTSKSTRKEDQGPKRALYRDVLRVPEYVQFDPFGEYLRPNLQGFRLIDGEYQPIEPVDGRLPSLVTGLQFEAVGDQLRLFSPPIGRWLPTDRERAEEGEARARSAETARRESEALARSAETARRDSDAARIAAEAELDRLRREIEALRNANGGR